MKEVKGNRPKGKRCKKKVKKKKKYVVKLKFTVKMVEHDVDGFLL